MSTRQPAAQKVIQGLTLDGLRSFEAAARLRSFTAAAEELCLTQSAVSKQIKSMEDWLGKPLFIRGARTLALTDAGQTLLKGTTNALRELTGCIREVMQNTRTSITVTAPPAFASLWLAPRLADYRRMACDVDIRLDASEAQVQLDRAGMDLAVRMAPADSAPADWTPLVTERLILLASPEMAQQVHQASDLLHCPLLEFDHRSARLPGMNWAHWFEHLGLNGSPTQARHRFTQYEHLLKAAQDGLGVAVGRLPLVADLINRDQLQRVLPDMSMTGITYHLVFSEDARERQEVQWFSEWLQSSITAPEGPPASC